MLFLWLHGGQTQRTLFSNSSDAADVASHIECEDHSADFKAVPPDIAPSHGVVCENNGMLGHRIKSGKRSVIP